MRLTLALACLLAVGCSTAAAGKPVDAPVAWPDGRLAYVPNEVIVGYENGRERVVRLAPGRAVARAVDAIERRPDVRFAAPNWIARASLEPLDRGTSAAPGGWAQDQWNLLERPGGIRIRRAWDRLIDAGHPGGRGTRIAVVDSGVAFTAAEGHGLAPDFVPKQFVAPRDFIDDDRLPLDGNGHGTHIAATIGGAVTLGKPASEPDYLTGIAYGAKLMPVRVLDREGAGPASAVARGIRWASKKRADVINLSFQFHPAVSSCDQVPTVCAAVRLAKRRGSLVVAAAGNAITGEGERGALFPARIPGVLGVGATTENGCLASYSHYGPGVEVMAPGGGVPAERGTRRECADDAQPILSLTYDCYPTCGAAGGAGRGFALRGDAGTSMASAHAAAVAALVIKSGAAGKRPKPRAIIRRLTCTAHSPGARAFYRAGLIDALRAVRPVVRCKR